MKMYRGPLKVIWRKDYLDRYAAIRFERPDDMYFRPGELIAVKVDDRTIRQYSISSGMREDYLEIFVDLSPGGPGTQLLSKLKVGDSAEVITPIGNFPAYYSEVYSTVVVVNGTGVAPFLSMIRTFDADTIFNFKLVWGVRDRRLVDIFQDLLDETDRDYYKFTYKICVTGDNAKEDDYKGRVTDFLKNEITSRELRITFWNYFLCGSRDMIEDVIDILKNKHDIKESNIYHEQFY